jgi:hypothetical protein
LADIATELERLRQINERVERNKIRLQRQQQDSLKVRFCVIVGFCAR